MTIPIKLPVTARLNITSNVFTAAFNAITPNRYDFTQGAGNQNQTLLQLNQNAVYIIERANFSMDIPEAEFQSAIDSTISVPVVKFTSLKTGQMVFPRKQPFINYVDNLELLKLFPCNQKDDELQVSFECLMLQTPAMIGLANLQAYFQLNIYEVAASEWTRRFFQPKTNEGAGLNFRGGLDSGTCS